MIKDKACISVGGGTSVGRNLKGGDSGSLGRRIMDRIHSLEDALAELKQQHERFKKEVQNDLLLKYQHLLDREQQRFDRLMAEYTQALQRDQPPKVKNSQKNDRKGPNVPAEKIEAKTKYARLLKMEEARQALKKEMNNRKT